MSTIRDVRSRAIGSAIPRELHGEDVAAFEEVLDARVLGAGDADDGAECLRERGARDFALDVRVPNELALEERRAVVEALQRDFAVRVIVTPELRGFAGEH